MQEDRNTGVGEPDGESLEKLAERVIEGKDEIPIAEELLAEPLALKAGENLLMRLRAMSVGERVKLALRGPKEVRTLLLRDTNPLVRKFVLQNPRISDSEIIAVAKNRSADEELLRAIGSNREWLKNYQVRLSLVTNPKTPLQIALRHLGSLADRDLRLLAKSKNVSSAVSSQARRLLFQRQTVR